MPCPQHLHTNTAVSVQIPEADSVSEIASSQQSHILSLSEQLLPISPHTPADRHTLNSAVWSGGRTGQQYPRVFNSTVSSLKTLKAH